MVSEGNTRIINLCICYTYIWLVFCFVVAIWRFFFCFCYVFFLYSYSTHLYIHLHSFFVCILYTFAWCKCVRARAQAISTKQKNEPKLLFFLWMCICCSEEEYTIYKKISVRASREWEKESQEERYLDLILQLDRLKPETFALCLIVAAKSNNNQQSDVNLANRSRLFDFSTVGGKSCADIKRILNKHKIKEK